MDIIDFSLITLSSVFFHEVSFAIISFTVKFNGSKNMLRYA